MHRRRVPPGATPRAALLAAATLAGCTIEHTQPLGADCLVTRECVAGLECLAQPDGRNACQRPRDASVFPPLDGAGTDAARPPDSPSDSGPDIASDSASDSSDPDDDAKPPPPDGGASALVRIAHLVPSMGRLPAVDVCVRPAGSTAAWTGPVLRAAGLTAGLALNQVSRYLALPPGVHDLRVVAAAAMSCDMPVLPPQTGLDLGAAGAHATVALFGVPQAADAGASPVAFRARVLRDRDPAGVSASPEPAPALRLFHAVPDPALRLDVGVVVDGMPPTLLAIFEDTGFGDLGRAPAARPTSVDAQGYYESAMPLPMVNVGARATCARVTPPCTNPILFRADGLAIRARTFSTAFLTARTDGTPGALVCVDSDPPLASGLAACGVRP